MPSPALDSFNATIDASALSTAAKTAVKTRAEQLYHETVREAAAHIQLHVAGVAAGTPEAGYLADVLVAFASRTDFHAADIAALLTPQTTVEQRWGNALGPIFAADTVARAGRIFDAQLLRFDSPGVRVRLKAFRDLVTAKLGP